MIRKSALALALLLALGAAQESPGDPAEGAKPFADPAGEASTPRQERNLRALLAIHNWKMTEAVGVSEDQAAQLFPRFREAFQSRWQLEARRRQLLRLFEKLSDPVSPQSEKLERLLAEWDESEAKLQASQRRLQETVKSVLTPIQQIKYLLFQERFQGDLIRSLTDHQRQRDQGHLDRQRPTGR